jgi:hypothetical protein
VVIGSQAILGSHPDPPPEMLLSMEVDAREMRRRARAGLGLCA